METCSDNVYSSLMAKIKETEDLRETCQQLLDISGLVRLQRKIESELRFLRKLSHYPEKLKEEHLRSSNLCHISATVKCCLEMPGVVKILEPFNYQEEVKLPSAVHKTSRRVIVDVISDHGRTWVKVVARNPLALLQSSLGDGKFGRRSIIEQAKDMQVCANQNPYMYTCPKVLVWFSAGVAHDLKVRLEEMGVTVLGTVTADDNVTECCHKIDNVESLEVSERSANTSGKCSSSASSRVCEHPQSSKTKLNISSENVEEKGFSNLQETHANSTFSDLSNINVNFNVFSIPAEAVFNLDVSTMIAQVSNLTNGFCNFQFQEEILSDQAGRERLFPVRKVLDILFKGHKLICCQTAYDDFTEILSTVSGEQEKVRASKMLADVSVVPDNPSCKALTLQTSSKVRSRSRIIFGTGDNLKAVTVTANVGFLRAAQSQGIKFVALVHESRALTEQKEKTAKPLDS